MGGDGPALPRLEPSTSSAPSRGMVVWAALHEIGVEGLQERVVRTTTRPGGWPSWSRHPSLEL